MESFIDPDGATPLTEEESRGLLLPIFSRAALNRVEAANISDTEVWLFSRTRPLRPAQIVEERWLKALHRRMYGQVWTWAGKYRTADRNIGVPHWQIHVDLRDLVADTSLWLNDNSPGHYELDESAVRFSHRLAKIHPFPNGNGRWSRLAADALVVALGMPRLTWGGQLLVDTAQLRRRYIDALQVADRGNDVRDLVEFARS